MCATSYYFNITSIIRPVPPLYEFPFNMSPSWPPPCPYTVASTTAHHGTTLFPVFMYPSHMQGRYRRFKGVFGMNCIRHEQTLSTPVTADNIHSARTVAPSLTDLVDPQCFLSSFLESTTVVTHNDCSLHEHIHCIRVPHSCQRS
jgi:hypothetical protein